MHVLDLKHEFGISPHVLPQVLIWGIHEVAKLALRDVVRIPWDKFGLDTVLKEFPLVAMALPLLLFQGSDLVPIGGRGEEL